MQAVERLLASADAATLPEVLRILEIGLHHEQQHQELILTDILHALAQNPTAPAYDAQWPEPPPVAATGFVDLPRGVHRIGWAGEGYCFDNECPAHEVLLPPARIARGLVTNAQWLEFMADGGYATPSLWLSDGWAAVEAEGWSAPGYWRERDGAWCTQTLAGLAPIDPTAAVRHVGYYEADAFARWAGQGPADRGAVGDRRQWRPHRRRLRHRVAMDPQRLFALSGLSGGGGRARRV